MSTAQRKMGGGLEKGDDRGKAIAIWGRGDGQKQCEQTYRAETTWDTLSR